MSEDAYNVFADPELTAAGINLQAVLAVAGLPDRLKANLAQAGAGNQGSLILFGNGGPDFWHAFQLQAPAVEHPVDVFSRRHVSSFMARRFPHIPFRFLYPGASVVPLQALGQLAGWHHDSPMKVGINDTWGLWYAYRALVLVEVELPTSAPVPSTSPCERCHDKPCLTACPAKALADETLQLERCIDFRLQEDSSCRDQCLARWACPVAPRHRYDRAQVAYHYGHSLPHLRQWRKGDKPKAPA